MMARVMLEFYLAGLLFLVLALAVSAILGGGKRFRDPIDYVFAALWPLSLFSARGRHALISIIKGTQS
jgi:hypothetical protein